MNVTVDSWAWFRREDLTDDQFAWLKKSLTIIPRRVGNYPGPDPDPLHLFVIRGRSIGVPREFFLTKKGAHEIDYQVTTGNMASWPGPVNFQGQLREEQSRALELVVGQLRNGQLGGILRASPGWGKTIWACALIAELQVPTLVVVHKEFLMTQWRDRIQQFLPGTKIGFVQQDTCDFAGQHVVIGMVHSLAGHDYPTELNSHFGLVFTDESVGYNAQVLTSRGYRKIGELVESKEPIEVMAWDRDSRRFVLRPLTHRWVHHPRSRMLRVEHEYGAFECTANHVVITPLGDVEAKNLVPGVDSVVHYSYDHSRETIQRSNDFGGGLGDGGRVFIPCGEVEGKISSPTWNSATGASSGEIHPSVRVVSDASGNRTEPGVYDKGRVPLFNSESRGLGRDPSPSLSERREVGEPGAAGRILVTGNAGVVGDGRRQCGNGAVVTSAHGELSSRRSRDSGRVVFTQGSSGDCCESPRAPSTNLFGGHIEGDSSVDTALCDRNAPVQSRALPPGANTSELCVVRKPDSFFEGEVWEQEVLRGVALPEGSKGGRLRVFGFRSEDVVRTLQGSEVCGVWKTDLCGEDAESCGVLRSLQASKSDSTSTAALLRFSEGVVGGHPVASRVLSVTEVETPDLVYDLSVGEHHNFVVDGVVLHNCHRIGAETWSAVPPKFNAKWRIGLSATPRRKDGADNVFLYHIGPLLFSAREQRMKPKIKRVWTTFKVFKTPSFDPNMAPSATLLRFLCADDSRNRQVVEQVVRAALADRKVLVLSERLKHLRDMRALFERMWEQLAPGKILPTMDYYVGGMDEDERTLSEKCQVIWATAQMTKEGLDIPALDTMALATPMGDVEQAVGRILRPYPGKKDPIVIDFIDDKVPRFRRMAEMRENLYSRISLDNRAVK